MKTAKSQSLRPSNQPVCDPEARFILRSVDFSCLRLGMVANSLDGCCECCAQIFDRASFCGCTAEPENAMLCRACWDVYNADQKPAEIKDRREEAEEGFCSNESCACCRPSIEGKFCFHPVRAGSNLCENCR
jgi:hypothetical protein